MMKRGQNCPDKYDPRERKCYKCGENHHSWNCQTYLKDWTRKKCNICLSGLHHDMDECKEIMRQKIKN